MLEVLYRFELAAAEGPSADSDAPAVAAEVLRVGKTLPMGATAVAGRGASELTETTAGVAAGSKLCIGKEAG